MGERSLLLYRPEARALHKGLQTQLRRPVLERACRTCSNVGELHLQTRHGPMIRPCPRCDGVQGGRCPLGRPGDTLWGRETWLRLESYHVLHGESPYVYRADCDAESERCREDYLRAGCPYHWRASVHMPRQASRAFLRVVSVRVERLQALSEADADACGAQAWWDFLLYSEARRVGNRWDRACRAAGWEKTDRRGLFAVLWDELMSGGPRWEDNPLVWVANVTRAETVLRPEEGRLDLPPGPGLELSRSVAR